MDLMVPCVEHCFIRLGKIYDSSCDSQCDYAKKVNENKQLVSEIEKVTSERDEALNCMHAIQVALENGDSSMAFEEIVNYNFHHEGRSHGED